MDEDDSDENEEAQFQLWQSFKAHQKRMREAGRGRDQEEWEGQATHDEWSEGDAHYGAEQEEDWDEEYQDPQGGGLTMDRTASRLRSRTSTRTKSISPRNN